MGHNTNVDVLPVSIRNQITPFQTDINVAVSITLGSKGPIFGIDPTTIR